MLPKIYSVREINLFPQTLYIHNFAKRICDKKEKKKEKKKNVHSDKKSNIVSDFFSFKSMNNKDLKYRNV